MTMPADAVTSTTVFVAEHRAVLAMQGGATRDVLQDTVTADVTGLAPERPVYTALLTPQGKFLVDFFLIDPGDGGSTVLIDVIADEAAALSKRLTMYAIRRDAKVLGETGLGVALGWGGAAPTAPDGALVVADPRVPTMGWRLYAPDPVAALSAMDLAPTAAEVGRAAYDALRVREQVPDSGAELVPGETFVLEAGLDRLGAVDFRKGCYVGQEVTARMRHKTELKKRLMPVAVEGSAPVGTPVTTAAGKPAGTLFTQADGRALAHLRLDRIDGPLSAGAARVIPDQPVSAASTAASPSR
ncbi:MAG: folate-binding protein [Pseudomonadota bacterium]